MFCPIEAARQGCFAIAWHGSDDPDLKRSMAVLLDGAGISSHRMATSVGWGRNILSQNGNVCWVGQGYPLTEWQRL